MTKNSSCDIIFDMSERQEEVQLNQILESKVKINIVSFFLANPERSFFSGELEKRLGSKSLPPHLNSLIKMDLLKTFSKKGKRYYIVNSKNDFWSKLRSAVSKILKKYEDELVKAVKKLPGVKVAVLSGLFAAQPDRECDLLLVGKIPQSNLDNFIRGAEKIAGQELNYALFTSEEYQYRKSIFDRFMKDIFEYPHIVIIEKIK